MAIQNNTRLKIVTTTKSNMDSHPVTDGSIYFLKDTHDCYYDDGSRIHLGCIEEVDNLSSILAPMEKIYFDKSDNCLKKYTNDHKWVNLFEELYLKKCDMYTKEELTNILKLKVQYVGDDSIDDISIS